VTEPDGEIPVAEARCPWCSSALPDGAERCPSCGAALRESQPSAEPDIPGVTQVDPGLRVRRPLSRPNRLVGWLADVDTEPASTIDLAAPSGGGAASDLGAPDAASVEPPSDDVRREIRRLELEALKAELEQRVADARVAALDAGQLTPSAPPAEPPASPEASPPEPAPTEDPTDAGDPAKG
jgi:hypothetical protein